MGRRDVVYPCRGGVLGHKTEQSTDTPYDVRALTLFSVTEAGHEGHELQESVYRKCPGWANP